MSGPADSSVQILREIRDAIHPTRTDLSSRIDQTRTELSARIDQTRTELSSRLDNVEETLVELATQQRFVVRHLTTLTPQN